jgi:hypothetical protein
MVVEATAGYDDLVALKEAVGFVAWQKELVEVLLDADSVASGNLLPILQ